MKIAFLHTAAIHQQTFDALLSNAQAEVVHSIEPSWLAQAQTAGLTTALREEVLGGLRALAQSADAVVCTCTTLGPVVDELIDEQAGEHQTSNVFRIDYPMMQVAAATSGRVMLAVCLDSTVQPSSEMLERAYAAEAATPNYVVQHCRNAWPHFEQHNQTEFDQSIADTVAAAVAEAGQGDGKIECIVLAQASMASAAKHIIERIPGDIKVLRSPPLAVMHALLLAAEHPREGIVRST